jgi:general secretion pathway protein D
VLSIDPSNAKAIHQLDVYEDFASLHEQSEIDHAYRSEGRGALIDAEEAKIPWYSDVLYPKNWLEITTRRKALEAGAGTSDEDADLNRVLDMQQDEVNFTDTPLVQAVDFLKDVNRVNVTVDWDDLADVGVDRERPISLSLRSIPLRTAFKELLNQAGGEAALGFAVRDGVLRIATRRTLDRDKHVVVYDIRDLLVDMPRFVNAPTLDLADSFKESGGGVSPARRDLFTTESPDDPDKALVLAQHDARVQEMLDIIRTNVAPDSWRETGGGDGALRELNGELIVYNTSDAHQQVTSLLDQLRETRALQISVESRFLIVSSNFLEEIGVDLDFVFNAGNASFDRVFDAAGVPVVDPFSGAAVLMPRQFSSIGATPAVPPFGNPLPQINVRQPYGQAGFVPQQGTVIPSFQDTTPIPLQQNSLALTNPQGLNTGIPGSLTDAVAGSPAMTIAGSFLDNLQVDFLIRATQANRRASIVQAPRLLMFNGQRANVVISRQRQYVSSLQPVVAEGAVGVTPIIGVVSSGVVLDVEGTIDHERKYVTLTVRTSLAQEPRLTPFEVQRGSGTSPSLFITLVDQETRRINTTVSVPDGGTVLLGGLKSSGEIEIDAGVPILSKLPVLKRAFTNSTTVKDTQTLLILLKSKILIQREAEEEAFPTLSNAGG